MTAVPAVSLERNGATAVLRMMRPDRRNALDTEMRAGLAAAIDDVRRDSGIRALVLTGSPECFCAGGDVRAMARAADGDRDVFEGRSRILDMHRWFEDLVDLEKPVIAAVNGAAFGAGLSLALAADHMIAAPTATFCAVFARVGFVPDLGAMYLLPRQVGIARAKELVFTARTIDAAEAKSIGLVLTLADDPVAEAMALATRLSAAPTEVIGIAKSILNSSFETNRTAILQQEVLAQALCREGTFHAEAVRRFVAREPLAYDWSRT